MNALKNLGVALVVTGVSGMAMNVAQAHDAGDILLRVGAATVFTNTEIVLQ